MLKTEKLFSKHFLELKMKMMNQTYFLWHFLFFMKMKTEKRATKCTLRIIEHSLQNMVISEEWKTYEKMMLERQNIWKQSFLMIFGGIRWTIFYLSQGLFMICFSCVMINLHFLIYDMWDSMIEQVKALIFSHEKVE